MNKTVVIALNVATSEYKCFGNFLKACQRLGLPYHFLKRQKATASKPITHSGYNLYRVPVE